MKKAILSTVLIALTTVAFAQCNQFYNLKEGTSWTISNFDAKGKAQGKTIQKVTAFSKSSDGFEATFKITSVDKKGEQSELGTSTMRCVGGVVYFDLEDMFPDDGIHEGF